MKYATNGDIAAYTEGGPAFGLPLVLYDPLATGTFLSQCQLRRLYRLKAVDNGAIFCFMNGLRVRKVLGSSNALMACWISSSRLLSSMGLSVRLFWRVLGRRETTLISPILLCCVNPFIAILGMWLCSNCARWRRQRRDV